MAAWGARSPLLIPRRKPPTVVSSSAQPQSGSAAAAPRVAAAPAASPLSAQDLGWQPPPIPTGAYNPIRDIELNAGKRGLDNTLEELLTKDTRGQSNLLLNEGDIATRETQEGQNHDQALAAIASSFKKLGVRQGEQARSAGVTRGGALLQSAAKRAANETKTREPVDQTYTRQQAADQTNRAQLILNRQREAEDDANATARAEREQAQFGVDTQTLEGREASDNGYTSPVSHLSIQPGAGFVRVGGPLKPNPAARKRR